MKKRILAIIAGVAALAGPALAHHSFAMFDNNKEKVLVGTVKEFQWTNPHTWIQINVTENGKMTEWSIEGGSPNGLSRRGWKRTSLKPGDKVTLKIHPLKDGTAGGSLMTVTGADGKVIGG